MTAALPTSRFRARVLLTLLALLIVTVALASFIGPHGLDTQLFSLRFARVLLALMAGCALAAAGSTLQALLANPLADPYVIGVSGGSALGGALAIVLGGEAVFSSVPLASIVGAFATSLLLLAFVRRETSGTPNLALLAGVALNAFAGAIITLFKTLLPAHKTQSMLFWLVGSVGYPSNATLILIGFTIAIGLTILITHSGALELLSLGDDEASRLGVEVKPVKYRLYFATSLLVGVIVAFCGMIGFIGLVIPQVLRLIVGSDQRILLPASALLGALTLVLFDAGARLSFVYFDTEIPVGALTAIVGAPMFAWMLLHNARGTP